MDADALWCYQIFRVIVGYMSPFDDGNLSDLMRLALVSKRVRTLVVRFLADPRTSARARARVFSDPLKFNRTVTDRSLGLLLPPGARLAWVSPCDEVWVYRCSGRLVAGESRVLAAIERRGYE